eukprot:scaffold89958_cov63-Phaeocystis_antarctica.AAC.2
MHPTVSSSAAIASASSDTAAASLAVALASASSAASTVSAAIAKAAGALCAPHAGRKATWLRVGSRSADELEARKPKLIRPSKAGDIPCSVPRCDARARSDCDKRASGTSKRLFT